MPGGAQELKNDPRTVVAALSNLQGDFRKSVEKSYFEKPACIFVRRLSRLR
jgi:hypothetical protein